MSAILGSLAGFSLSGFIQGLEPVTRALNYTTNTNIPNALLEPPALIDLFRRKIITKDEYYGMMKNYGFDASAAKLSFRANDSLLSPEQAVSFRIEQELSNQYDFENGLITAQERSANQEKVLKNYYQQMRNNGYLEGSATEFFRSYRPIPTFSDLREWMIKEVFEPETIKSFGLDKEVPQEWYDYTKFYGVPANEALKHWISHWQPIGAAKFQEMFRRIDSTRDDIDTSGHEHFGFDPEKVRLTKKQFNDYFKVLEFPPAVRDAYLATIYDPLPFTILQQAFQYGELSESQLIGYLKDYGYSPKNSKIIKDTWVKKYAFEIRNPISDSTLKQFKLQKISETQARTKLIADGLSEETSDFHIALIKDAIEEERVKNKINSLTIQYGKEKITDAQLDAHLANLVPEITRREYIKNVIQDKSTRYQTRVSDRVIRKGVTDNLITREELIKYMNSKRFSVSDMDIYLKALGLATLDSEE